MALKVPRCLHPVFVFAPFGFALGFLPFDFCSAFSFFLNAVLSNTWPVKRDLQTIVHTCFLHTEISRKLATGYCVLLSAPGRRYIWCLNRLPTLTAKHLGDENGHWSFLFIYRIFSVFSFCFHFRCASDRDGAANADNGILLLQDAAFHFTLRAN